MRLTYRSAWGDYGCAQEFVNDYAEKCAFRNKLGKFEDAYEWNPISKCGLPKKDGTYYVTVHDPCSKSEDFVLRDEFYDGKFKLESVSYEVLAWMNILTPEPYTEDK